MEMSGQPCALATLPQQKSHYYPLNRRLGGPQNRSNVLEKRYISCPCWDLKPGSSSL